MTSKFTLILKKSEIVEESNYCSYCGDKESSFRACCGEVHYEKGYEMADGDIHLESEVDGWEE